MKNIQKWFIQVKVTQTMQMTSKDVFNAINAIRNNPQSVSLPIKEQLYKFDSNTGYRNSQGTRIRTMSGKQAWQDAILSLERQKPKISLQWNQALSMAAEQYKSLSVQNPDINPYQILAKYCTYDGAISIISNQCDADNNMNQIMASIVVGDGDDNKSARVSLFHPVYKEFGCSIETRGKKMLIHMIYAERVQKNANISNNSLLAKSNPIISNKSINIQNNNSVIETNKSHQSQNQQNQVANNSFRQQQKFQKFGTEQDERLLIKKTSKIHTVQRNGRSYRVTWTKFLYEDQTEEELIEEELIR